MAHRAIAYIGIYSPGVVDDAHFLGYVNVTFGDAVSPVKLTNARLSYVLTLTVDGDGNGKGRHLVTTKALTFANAMEAPTQ